MEPHEADLRRFVRDVYCAALALHLDGAEVKLMKAWRDVTMAVEHWWLIMVWCSTNKWYMHMPAAE